MMGESFCQKRRLETGDTGVLISKDADEINNGPDSVTKQMESKKLRGRVEVDEQLLPGILNEITLKHVVTTLPWSDIHALSCVSRGWQQAIHSRQVYDARVRTQCTQTVVLLMDNRSVDNDDDNGKRLALFSPNDGFFYNLPPIPGVYRNKGLPQSFQCISLDGKVYVMGGLEIESTNDFSGVMITRAQGSAKAYMFDIVGERKWKQCASMAEPRALFGCGVVNGKIYVIGGTSSWIEDSEDGPVYCGCEVYDPLLDTWTPIASTHSFGLHHQVASVGEKLWAHSQFYGSDFIVDNPVEVYNPFQNEWETLDDSYLVGDMDLLLTVRGKIHNLGYHGICLLEPSGSHCRSFSFGAFPEGSAASAILLAATIVDDELLDLVNYRMDSNDIAGGSGFSLMKSQGLGGQNRIIEWQNVQSNCLLALGPIGDDCAFLCPVQL